MNLDSFLANGVLLSVFGALLYQFKNTPVSIFNYFKSFLYTEVQINNRTQIWHWAVNWFGTRKRINYRSMIIQDSINDDFSIIPNSTHIIKYNKARIFILYHTSGQASAGDNKLFLDERYYLRTFFWNRKVLFELIKEMQELYVIEDICCTRVHYMIRYGWVLITKRDRQYANNLVYSPSLVNTAITSLQHFYDNEVWFRENNIPYKKGILLYGPPGTGKTSFILMLAAHFKKHLYFIDMSASISDEDLLMNVKNTPDDSILIIEDVDRSFDQSGQLIANTSSRITLKTILNLMDGSLSVDKKVLIFTANKLDHMDEALLRAGRIDDVHYLGFLDKSLIIQLWNKFYKNETFLAELFADKLMQYESYVTPAKLQSYFIRHPVAKNAYEEVYTFESFNAIKYDYRIAAE